MTTMINTRKIRAKVDGLSAADGADTYWRLTMLDALHDIESLEAQVSNRDSALEAARIRIADLTAERDQWAGYNPEQVKRLVEERIEQGKMIAAMSASVAELRAIEADTRYEVGIMSAITGRRDNETLTEAVTRVCHQLADTGQLLADKNTTANTFMEQIKRLQQIVEKQRKEWSDGLLAAFTEFQATLPPVDSQTEYSAGARYAMITILENLRRKQSPPSGIVETPLYEPPFQTARCVYPVGRTTCGYTEGNHKHADGVHEFTSSLVFYDPCQTCNPNGSGQCFGHGRTIEEREDAPLPADIASDNPDDWAIEAEQTADIGHGTLPICQCAHSKPLHFNNGQCVAVGCGCKGFTFEGSR